ncbi:amidohydrolase family protein [Frondihabitans cladoniiphilus]|uniref:Amidohydrolase family protein n=1 Tax=Frondihabitans cladoniiphilus TaxID=715785 RepID=A0ABP8W9V2_9MICO
MRTITLEEHFVSQRFLDTVGINLGGQRGVDLSGGELTDLADTRLRHMDASGIDMQVLSHVVPTFAPLPHALQVDISTAANNQAAEAVAAHPDRFAAFATLPVGDVDASVTELERAVKQLGFKGALLNGRADGKFLDDPELFPLLVKAAELNVPLYLHPGLPTEALRNELYSGFGPSVGYALSTAAWGWHAEAGLHALRLIAAGIFESLPNLHIILGHLGEMVPYMIDRADEWLSPAMKFDGIAGPSVAETFRSNFWITTSGMFSSPQFLLALQVLGAERIMFSVDYPFSPNSQGRAFFDGLEISPFEKEKVSHLNAEQLLGL